MFGRRSQLENVEKLSFGLYGFELVWVKKFFF